MESDSLARRLEVRPHQIAAKVLGLVCCTEAIIMLVFPQQVEATLGRIGVAALDASLLTLILVPGLWWVIVVPHLRMARCRQDLLSWALAAQERKANELSRELHDGLGQLATAISLGISTIDTALESNSNSVSVQQQTSRLRELGHQLHESIRELSRGLRPRVLDDHGLAAAVENYAAEMQAAYNVEIVVEVEQFEEQRLASPIETTIFRIIQEGVTNAVRHGRPTSIRVHASRCHEAVSLDVQDNGIGFESDRVFQYRPGQQTPFGLISVRERVDLLGGRTRIQSTSGHGTRLQVWIPLRRKGE